MAPHAVTSKKAFSVCSFRKKVKSVQTRHIPRLSPYLDEYLKLIDKSIDDIQDAGYDSFAGISDEIMSNALSASILKRRWRS